MSERTFGGFRYRDRLETRFYGDVFRGSSSRRGTGEVRVLQVSDELARHEAFGEALIHFGRAYALLKHDNVVRTRTVGWQDDGRLIVITDRVAEPITLEELLASHAGALVEPGLGLAIASGIIDGLAYLHSVGLCHGALHPRSVWLDDAGRVTLGDCATGRALAAVGRDEARLLSSLGEYVAPELAAGHDVSAGCDVYAAGRILTKLVAAGSELEPVVRKAVNAEPSDRYGDGGGLKRAFDLTVRTAEIDIADTARVAELARRQRTGAARIGSRAGLPPPPSGLDDALDGLDGLDDDLDDLVQHIGELDPPDVVAPRIPAPRVPRPRGPGTSPQQSVAFDGSSVEPESTGELTAVEDLDAILAQRQSISELIKLGPGGAQGEGDPVPNPIESEDSGPATAVESRRAVMAMVHRSRNRPLDGGAEVASVEARAVAALDGLDELVGDGSLDEAAALAAATDTGETNPLPERDRRAHAVAAPGGDSASPAQLEDDDELDAGIDELTAALQSEFDDEVTTPEPVPAISAPFQTLDSRAVAAFEHLDGGVASDLEIKKSRGLLWMAAAVIAAGSAFGFVYTQTDVFHPERARAKAEARERAQRDEIARLRAAQDKPGTLVVTADQEEAAVWLLLGRTPLTTPFKLPASQISDLRFVREGYQALDVPVIGPMWTTGESGRGVSAAVHARLEKGERGAPVPAYPAPPDPEPPAGPEGQGYVRVESTPPETEVWLLVGFSPEVKVSGLVAGEPYRLEIRKEGFEPARVVFEDSDWFLSGEAGVGSVKQELRQSVKLEPASK